MPTRTRSPRNRYRDFYHDVDIVVRPRSYGRIDGQTILWWEAYIADDSDESGAGAYLGRGATLSEAFDAAHDRIDEMNPDWFMETIRRL